MKNSFYTKSCLKILLLIIERYNHTEQMINFVTKFMKYLFTVLYEIEKNESGLLDKTKSPINDKSLKSKSLIIMSNTLFPGRGVACEFEPLVKSDKKKDIKRQILLNIVSSLIDIENVHIKERGVLIIRTMMSKLKFKYGLKPAWLENLKKLIRKGNIPLINTSLKQIQGRNNSPMVQKDRAHKFRLNNQTLDDYIIDDASRNDELISEVPLLSSDGFLKHSVEEDGDSAK